MELLKVEKKKKQLCQGFLAKIESVFPCLIDCLPLIQVYFGDDLQENDHTASTTNTKEYSFEVAKSTIVGTYLTTATGRIRCQKRLLVIIFFYQHFSLQKAEMQRLFTVKTLSKTNCAQTMSFVSNFSRATNQTTSLYVENNF